MKVIPLEDRVLIKTAELEEKTKSGLFIPQTAQEKTQVGVVTAVGNDKENITVKVGQKIIIEVHPQLNEGDLAPSCLIKYSDTLALEQEGGIQDQQLLVTPTVKRNTKDVYGRVTSSLLTTTVAAFEIVEINDGNGNTFRSWELDVGSDESNYIAGLAQMLGEHTDTVVPDIVHAQDISRSNLRTIDVIYPCTSCGYVMANFLKTVNTPNDTTWSAIVQIINPLSDAAFGQGASGRRKCRTDGGRAELSCRGI